MDDLFVRSTFAVLMHDAQTAIKSGNAPPEIIKIGCDLQCSPSIQKLGLPPHLISDLLAISYALKCCLEHSKPNRDSSQKPITLYKNLDSSVRQSLATIAKIDQRDEPDFQAGKTTEDGGCCFVEIEDGPREQLRQAAKDFIRAQESDGSASNQRPGRTMSYLSAAHWALDSVLADIKPLRQAEQARLAELLFDPVTPEPLSRHRDHIRRVRTSKARLRKIVKN